jgi:hypothetical protein
MNRLAKVREYERRVKAEQRRRKHRKGRATARTATPLNRKEYNP